MVKLAALNRFIAPSSAKGGKQLGSNLKLAWFLSVLVLVGLISSCRPHRFTEGIITTVPTSVGSDWVSILMVEPMTAKWDAQTIAVEVNSSFQVSYKPVGIKLNDGSVAAPEAELITKEGQRQPLRLVGLTSGELYFSSDQIARGNTFSELRIRSPKTLNCSRITWMSYMPQDSKYSKYISN
jgi:hypothetical protein